MIFAGAIQNVKFFQRTGVKTSGLEYQTSRPAGPYQSGIKTFPHSVSLFLAHPRVSDEYRGAFEKISQRHREPSNGEKKKRGSVNSLSMFKKPMKPNLALKHGDDLI